MARGQSSRGWARWGALALGAVVAGGALAASVPPTRLARPTFPPPATAVVTPGGRRLALVASRYRAPGLPPGRPSPPSWAPRTFRGADLLDAARQPGLVFLLYGLDGTSARYVVAATARTGRLRYALDFGAFLRPPRVAPGAGSLVDEQVVWAREADGVVYVETSHQTYAAASGGLNGYLAAVDLRGRRTLWRSPALVANARTFVLAGDVLVTGYGFTREPDFLYVLDRGTGRVLDRLRLPSAPERIVRRGDRLHVRTYDHDVVVALRSG